MVRVKVMSDIHVDVNASILGLERKEFLNVLLDYLFETRNDFDILLFVGDLSNDMLYSLKILNNIDNRLENKKIIKFVPGNHDVSFSRGYGKFEIDSPQMLNLYNESKYGLLEPLELSSNTVLIGGLGWYDYSYYNLFLGDKKEELGLDYDFNNYMAKLKYQYWFDGSRINFADSDVNICSNENSRYENLINAYKDKDIFLINHFVPFYRYVKVDRSNEIWNVCNAFIGSEALGDIIEKNKNVKYVAFGHTHFRFGLTEIGERKEICVPLGYFGEWSEFENLSDNYNCSGQELENFVKKDLTFLEKSQIIKKELKNLNTIITIK